MNESSSIVDLTPRPLALLLNSHFEQLIPQQDLLLQNLREEVLTSLFIGEDVGASLEGKVGKRIKTDKKTRINKEIFAFR